MKVFHCIPSMAGGGAERQLAYLARGLVSLGVETHVALTTGGENQERLRRSGAVVHEIPVANNHSPALPLALHRRIRQVRPAIVQTWLTQMDIVGGAAALWNGVPWIMTERNSAGRYTGRLKDRIRLRLGRRAAALVANSATGLEYWNPHLKSSAGRRVIANGLPVDEIISTPPIAPADSPAGPGEKLIVFAGRLHSAKNVHGLISALRLLNEQTRFKAVLFGQGPERENLTAQIAREGLSQQVQLQGYSAQLWSWMKRADVFVSVSFSEGLPNTVMEAMASRCPLVVSDIPEHREFLDESLARLVDPSQPEAIARALGASLGDKEGSLRRAEASAQRASQWSVESMSKQYLELYGQCLNSK
jgi:glycosyltransferase involved in cell wall biosynthesis